MFSIKCLIIKFSCIFLVIYKIFI